MMANIRSIVNNVSYLHKPNLIPDTFFFNFSSSIDAVRFPALCNLTY